MAAKAKGALWSLHSLIVFLRLGDLGYTLDHCRYALQMAVAISISMVFVVVNPVYDALDQRSYWTVVTTAFVLEPTLGSALNKGAQGMLGAFIGAALGIGSQAIAGELVGDYNYNRESAPLAVASTACIAVVTFFLMLHRLRYAEYSHLWHVSIYTVAIVAVPGIHDTRADYVGMCKLLGATAIGVAIAFIVSFTVFPSRALGQVQRLMATSLERMANLSFHVLGQLCEAPDDLMRMPGSTGTDRQRRFVDDGLEERYETLHMTAVNLAADFSRMEVLLRSAMAERYLYFRKPVIPVRAYKRSARAASRVLTQMAGLLHAYETGTMRLGLVQEHASLLQAVRQDTATALTALSGLIFASIKPAYAEQKIQDLVSRILELQQGVEGATFGAAYGPDLETLAAVTKVAATAARQISLLYCELNSEGCNRLHDDVACKLAQPVPPPDPEKGRATPMQPPQSVFAHATGMGSDRRGKHAFSAGGMDRMASGQHFKGLDLNSVSTTLGTSSFDAPNSSSVDASSHEPAPQRHSLSSRHMQAHASSASMNQQQRGIAHLRTVSSSEGLPEVEVHQAEDASQAEPPAEPSYYSATASGTSTPSEGARTPHRQATQPAAGSQPASGTDTPSLRSLASEPSYHADDNPFE